MVAETRSIGNMRSVGVARGAERVVGSRPVASKAPSQQRYNVSEQRSAFFNALNSKQQKRSPFDVSEGPAKNAFAKSQVEWRAPGPRKNSQEKHFSRIQQLPRFQKPEVLDRQVKNWNPKEWRVETPGRVQKQTPVEIIQTKKTKGARIYETPQSFQFQTPKRQEQVLFIPELPKKPLAAPFQKENTGATPANARMHERRGAKRNTLTPQEAKQLSDARMKLLMQQRMYSEPAKQSETKPFVVRREQRNGFGTQRVATELRARPNAFVHEAVQKPQLTIQEVRTQLKTLALESKSNKLNKTTMQGIRVAENKMQKLQELEKKLLSPTHETNAKNGLKNNKDARKCVDLLLKKEKKRLTIAVAKEKKMQMGYAPAEGINENRIRLVLAIRNRLAKNGKRAIDGSAIVSEIPNPQPKHNKSIFPVFWNTDRPDGSFNEFKRRIASAGKITTPEEAKKIATQAASEFPAVKVVPNGGMHKYVEEVVLNEPAKRQHPSKLAA